MKPMLPFFLLVWGPLPLAWALFGGGDSATEITQSANLLHLESQKDQGRRQLATQLLELTNQLHRLVLAERAARRLDTGALARPDAARLSRRLDRAFPLEESRLRLARLREVSQRALPALGPARVRLEEERVRRRRAELERASGRVADAALAEMEESRRRMEGLERLAGEAHGELQAVQLANEALAERLLQWLHLREETLWRHQLEIERLSLEEEERVRSLAAGPPGVAAGPGAPAAAGPAIPGGPAMRRALALALGLLILAPSPSPALFGSNPLSARESTQLANRAQIRKRLKLQARQYLAQVEEWRAQNRALALGEMMARPLASRPRGSLDTLRRASPRLEASLARMRALPGPEDLQGDRRPRALAERRKAAADGRIRISRDYSLELEERREALRRGRLAMEQLREASRRAEGLFQALQIRDLLEGELSGQLLHWQDQRLVHRQALDEKRAQDRALADEIAAQRKAAAERARDRIAAWRREGR